MVTDVALWTKGYASLMAILTMKRPNKALQFMCYLHTIIKANVTLKVPCGHLTMLPSFAKELIGSRLIGWQSTYM